MSETQDRAAITDAPAGVPGDSALCEAAAESAALPDAGRREPQWGEAYLLYDGHYVSLDDLLRGSDD
jgi:hypothetical protein